MRTIIKTEAHLRPGSPRARDWEKVFGGLSVPLLSPGSVIINGPRGLQEFYQVDVAALSPEQRTRVVDHIVDRFGIPRAQVEEGLDDPLQGLPILVEDVGLTIYDRPVAL